MNRSILIVIADFLLISLLAFSDFDSNKLVEHRPVDQATPKPAADGPFLNQDLVGVLKGAVDDERRAREQLAGELTLTKEEIRGQVDLMAERENQNQLLQQNLQLKDRQTQQLERERRALRQQYAAAQTNLQVLTQQLKATTSGALMTKEKLQATEAELRKEQETSAAMQKQLAQLEQNRQALEADKVKLADKLRFTEAEKRAATEQLATLQGEVQTVRTEKAQILQHADKLAEGVTTLAQSSDKLADRVSTLAKSSVDLTKEVRENRSLGANAIFSELVTNRVHAQFQASRSGLLGIGLKRDRESETVLVTDGTGIFALCHVEETPLALWTPGTDWEKLTGTLSRVTKQFPIERMSFYLMDPRIVLMPVTAAQARQLGCRVYRIAADPFKFQDAVLVGSREGYYGECKFQMDMTTPQYVKMDRNLFRGLFGKFNPSRSDLVFTMTGELLGIMANSTYCIVIHNFNAAATLQFGDNMHAQNTAEMLSQLHLQITQLPLKLQ